MISALVATRHAAGPKFTVDRKTGFPLIKEEAKPSRPVLPLKDDEDTEDSDDTSRREHS